MSPDAVFGNEVVSPNHGRIERLWKHLRRVKDIQRMCRDIRTRDRIGTSAVRKGKSGAGVYRWWRRDRYNLFRWKKGFGYLHLTVLRASFEMHRGVKRVK